MDKKIHYLSRYRFNISGFSTIQNDVELEGYLQTKSEFSPEGKLILQETFDSNEQLEQRNTYTYNEHGNLISEAVWFDDDSPAEKRELKYNEKQQVTEEQVHYETGGIDLITYEYSANGELIKKTTQDDEGEVESITEWTHTNGKIKTERVLGVDNNELIFKQYTYSDKGDILQVEYRDSDENRAYTTFHEYNEQNQHIKSRVINDNNQLIERYAYQYDDKNQLIEYIEETALRLRKIIHEYDEAGRTILQEEYDKNDLLVSRSEFEYDENGLQISNNTGNTRTGENYILKDEYEFYE